ncbi:MAG: DUF91 domain-containing protein [Actinobacteria bacterium]|uniref:Unannotated protein n=1 Tax=freshwater metagenome TaxID=449393 RepID=A0A6J7NAW9_9ZZZZ|nr:DUF91 domain-containing protein [Actinomycetota bacterium]MSX78875.1 DUF91 domain-containing protein [Actinomycetota bacterium]
MADELVFSVEGPTATAARQISLAEAGFTERAHLQEWIIQNPQVLGEGVLIVTFEFDRWRNATGTAERDRLDVLGIDRNGTLVVAELKRGAAPDTVEMQAIKYAAMASRFSVQLLAEAHSSYLSRSGASVSADQALELLRTHTGYTVDNATFRRPRIVLVAESYPPIVTATAVWLGEMGVPVNLVRVQAYELVGTAEPTRLVSVSQLYPVPEVESFMVGPRSRGDSEQDVGPELPEIEWSESDYAKLRALPPKPTVQAILDLCSASPDTAIGLRVIEAAAGRTVFGARGELAGLTMLVKGRFKRRNWPFSVEWGATNGVNQAHYRMSAEQAERWISSAGNLEESPTSRLRSQEINDFGSPVSPAPHKESGVTPQ